MEKSLRIRANVGKDQFLHFNMKQDVDFFEILSLTLSQKDAYKIQTSNYGVIVGRVLANNAFGVPNAKVSVFIPLTDEDALDSNLSSLYPYTSSTGLNKDGVRYNLLPTYSNDECYTKVGTFPSKRAVLDNDTVLEMYDKYYKFTATTNKAGDYMIFGVPTGNTQVHVDVDLSDIGILSQKPRDFVYKGYNINQFDSPTKFKSGTNLDNLAQIYGQNDSVNVYPFWGDENAGEVAISRKDINLQYEFNTTCVFLGSAVTDSKNNSISHECDIEADAGELSQLVAGEGTIEMIRKTAYGNVEEFSIQGNQLIDSDGVWCYQIPMNLDYVGMDEYGNIVPTNDPTKGIPTRARVRFRISLNESGTDTLTRHKAKYLVPNNPLTKPSDNAAKAPTLFGDSESNYNDFYTFGSATPECCFRDLLWNNVYTVKSYIPRVQKSVQSDFDFYSGIKGVNKKGAEDKNTFPFNKLKLQLSTTSEGLFKYLMDNFDDKDYYFWHSIRHRRLLPNKNPVIESVIDENDGISLDFYNDWVNGALYFPLWFWRMRKKNKRKNGELVYDSRFCDSNYRQKSFFNVSTCDLPYVFNNDKATHNIEIDLTDKDYKDIPTLDVNFWTYVSNFIKGWKNYLWFKKERIDYDRKPSPLELKKGVIVEKNNKDNIKVYYYSHSEVNRDNALIRLYSTDIVLLGSLSDNDINGIPQIGDFYPITSANVPPIGSYKPNVIYEATVNEGGGIADNDVDKILEEDSKDNTSITGMHWGFGNDVAEPNEMGIILSKGLFFGTKNYGRWFTAYTLPKSCINVERICEIGVSLDMSTLDKTNGNVSLNNFGVHDGLITKREIEDEYSRQLFSTLNKMPLIVSSENINPFTGYGTYPINYCCPTDFDGKMFGFVKDFTSGYSYDDESLEYESFRFGGYKDYQFNIKTTNEDNGKINYYFPAYNNSYYFYFGLNQGQTAIEKFKKQFYAKCGNQEELPFNVETILVKTPTLCNPNGGEISFKHNNTSINTFDYTITNVNNVSISGTDKNVSGLTVGRYTVEISGYSGDNSFSKIYKGKITSVVDVSYPTPLLSISIKIKAPDETGGKGSFKIDDIIMYGRTYTDIQDSIGMFYVGGLENLYLKYELLDSDGNTLTVDDDYTLNSENGIWFKNLSEGEYTFRLQEMCRDSEDPEKFTPVGDMFNRTISIKYIEVKEEENGQP